MLKDSVISAYGITSFPIASLMIPVAVKRIKDIGL